MNLWIAARGVMTSGQTRRRVAEEKDEWPLASDRVLRFPDRTWDELEGLPQPLRNAAHTAIFHLLEEPVPASAGHFPNRPATRCLPSPSSVGRNDHLVLRHGES